MNTIKAKQLLPFLLKWADVCVIEDGKTGKFYTLEEDGIEEYVIPEGEQWSYQNGIIENISVQINGDSDENDNLVIWMETEANNWCFGMEEDIDLDKLKRYQMIPLSFELPIIDMDNVGHRYVLNQAKYQTIYDVMESQEQERTLDDLIKEEDLADCIPPELIGIMFLKTQEWCDSHIDDICDLITKYNIITKVREKYKI